MARDDLLGFDVEISLRKLSKRMQVEEHEVESALDALKYLILHIAKTQTTV
jgi:hypothetical protein